MERKTKPVKEPRTARSYWREHVLAHSEYLASLLAQDRRNRREPDDPTTAKLRAEIESLLKAARRCAGERVAGQPYRGRGLMDVWSGAAVEGAYLRLHEADALMVDLLPRHELAAASGALREELGRTRRTDPRIAGAYRELVRAPTRPGPAATRRRRAAYRQALRAKHAVVDEQHARIRSFRNVIVVASLALFLIAVGIAVWGILEPSVLPLCFHPPGEPACPSGETSPSPMDVPIVMALGLAGGALASAVAIRTIRGSSTPYMVPLVLAGLKLPAGSMTSFLGLMLLNGDFIPGFSALDSQEQVLAYAIVLGYAQQIATRLVDRQAHDVLDRVSAPAPTYPPDLAVPAGTGGPLHPAPQPGDLTGATSPARV